MSYLQVIPTELIDITISFLEYDDINKFISILPYSDLIKWGDIGTYHFGFYQNLNKDKYITYIAIESFKRKLNVKSLSALSVEQIYFLETLDLSKNKLTVLPAEIGFLTNLKTLILTNNQLITLPAEIGNLINLKILNIVYNRLTSLPAEIGKLVNLKTLSLYHNNQLITLPVEMNELKNLETLVLPRGVLSTDRVPPNLRSVVFWY